MRDQHNPPCCFTCSLQSNSELGETELRISRLSGDLNAAPSGISSFIPKNSCRLMVTDRLILYLECFCVVSVFQF